MHINPAWKARVVTLWLCYGCVRWVTREGIRRVCRAAPAQRGYARLQLLAPQFSASSPPVPCLTWVQRTGRTAGHLGVADLTLWLFHGGEPSLTVVWAAHVTADAGSYRCQLEKDSECRCWSWRWRERAISYAHGCTQPLEARPGQEIRCSPRQQSPTFLPPGTSFLEDSFFCGLVEWGMGWGWFKHNRVHAAVGV